MSCRLFRALAGGPEKVLLCVPGRRRPDGRADRGIAHRRWRHCVAEAGVNAPLAAKRRLRGRRGCGRPDRAR